MLPPKYTAVLNLAISQQRKINHCQRKISQNIASSEMDERSDTDLKTAQELTRQFV